MKFSKETIQVLKSFKNINENLTFNNEDSGLILTVDAGKSIVAEYELPKDETEIKEFSIFNLSDFIRILSLFKLESDDCKFKFNEENGGSTTRYTTQVVIQDKQKSVAFYLANKGLFTPKMPSKKLKMPESLISFKLPHSLFEDMKKTADIFGSDVSFKVTKGKVIAIIRDKKNITSNTIKIIVDDVESKIDKEFSFDIEHLRYMIPGDYIVNINEKFGSFESESIPGLGFHISQVVR